MISLILIFSLFAQDTIIQSESSSDIEFEQYLLNNPHKKSYLQNYIAKNNLSHDLLDLLKKAQYEFINGSMEEAIKNFKRITDIRHKDNWTLNQRKTINYAFYRLAQLEQDPNIKKNYLKEAVIFDQSISPEEKLFPPPLIAQFYKIKNSLSAKVWPLPKNSTSFKGVIINGKLHTHGQSFIKTTPGVKRFTFISNKFKEVTLITEPSHLKNHKITLTPLAKGSCESPHFQSSINKNNFFSYYGDQCILPTNIQASTTLEAPSFKESPSLTRKTVFSKNSTWVWVGLTALSAVVTWQIMENQKGSSPSHTPSLNPTEKYISNSKAGN